MAKKDQGSLREYVDQVASRRGWAVNSDNSLTEPVVAGLTKNSGVWGRPFCPCRDLEGNPESNADIVCPCRYSAADIAEFGQCYCGLYLRVGINPSAVASIPERRPET